MRTRSTLVLVSAAVLFAWMTSAAPYAAADPGAWSGYTVVTGIAAPSFFDELPQLSADGSTLAFLGADPVTNGGLGETQWADLYLARGDFHAARKIASQVAYAPAVSADGSHIAYLGWDGVTLQAFAYDADTGLARQLSYGPLFLVNPLITPDGQTVFFHAVGGGAAGNGLYMVPFDGSAPPVRVATSMAAYFGESSIGGSGRLVAYLGAGANPWASNVWVLDTVAGTATQLTRFPDEVTARDVMLSGDGLRALVITGPTYALSSVLPRAWLLSVPEGAGGSCSLASDAFLSPGGFVATQDARHLFFSALPAGAYTVLSTGQSREDIWELNLDDCSFVQVTDVNLSLLMPTVSADASVMAFMASPLGRIVVAKVDPIAG